MDDRERVFVVPEDMAPVIMGAAKMMGYQDIWNTSTSRAGNIMITVKQGAKLEAFVWIHKYVKRLGGIAVKTHLRDGNPGIVFKIEFGDIENDDRSDNGTKKRKHENEGRPATCWIAPEGGMV
jgi:hypothetical protein